MKTAEEIYRKWFGYANDTTRRSLVANNVVQCMEEYASQFQPKWISVLEMKGHKIGDNTIFLFDDGSIKRYEESFPFAQSTHFFILPQPPKED